MAFKIYFNKKTRHPSISLSGKEKKKKDDGNLITQFELRLGSTHHLLQISNNISTDLSNKKDDSVDRLRRLMDTGELAPWNHLKILTKEAIRKREIKRTGYV